MKLALSEITADQRAQPRATMDVDVVGEYGEDMKRGDRFPPVVVFFDGAKHWLADGFHRYYGAVAAERDKLECDIRQGGLREAILFSCGANGAHGARRTNDDKRRAVSRLLQDDEWGKWSDEEIARRAAVSDTFVGKIRKEIRRLEDTSNVGGMERTFTHPKTGQPSTMTFAPRSPQEGALIAKSLHEIERHFDMMPDPKQAVADFPEDQRYFFPPSKIDEMVTWLTAFAAAWRTSFAKPEAAE